MADISDTPFGTGGPTALERRGYKIPSVYKGKNLMDTVRAAGFEGMPEFNRMLAKRGVPPIGSAGGEESLKLLNKMVSPADQYVKIPAAQSEAESLITKTTAKTKGNRVIRQVLSDTFDSIQKKADDLHGSVKSIANNVAKQEEKLKYITSEIGKKFPAIAAKGVDLVRRIGFAMVMGGPSMIGADLIPESILESMAEDMGFKTPEPMTFKGGGMASMDDMTAPLGYAHGGMHYEHGGFHEPITTEQIIREAKASRGPKKETHPIKKIISDRIPVDPYSVLTDDEFKRKDPIEMIQALGGKGARVAGELFGGRGAKGSELQERIDKLIIDIQVENMSPDPNYKRIDGLNNQLKYFTSLLKD